MDKLKRMDIVRINMTNQNPNLNLNTDPNRELTEKEKEFYAKLEKQIKETMEKAFWDNLSQDLASDPIKSDHLIKLIEEIRDRIINLTPNNNYL